MDLVPSTANLSAEEVRIDDLGHGRRGIAVEILMPLYLGGKETLK
jgi:hypothetical protein